MHLVCINLDKLEPKQFLQPCQKEYLHGIFGDLQQVIDHGWNFHHHGRHSVFIIELHLEHVSMCFEEDCFVNVAPIYHLGVVEGESCASSPLAFFFLR